VHGNAGHRGRPAHFANVRPGLLRSAAGVFRNSRRPCANIEIGHFSAALPHLANILARTGRRQLAFDPARERFLDAPDADVLTTRTYREGHWARLFDESR